MVAAVAPVGGARLGHALEVLVDGLAHPALQQVDQRPPRRAAVVLAPFDPLGSHGLHHLERSG
jgi:hypothetical protein